MVVASYCGASGLAFDRLLGRGGRCGALRDLRRGRRLEGEEPAVPVLADQSLADVADCSAALRSSVIGSDEAEQNQWNAMLDCASTT